MRIKIIKMQGIGNDYIFLDKLEQLKEDDKYNYNNLISKISDRHYGVGSDGVVVMYKSQKHDCFMQMYNNDGSVGKMCGNAIRCVAKYLYQYDKLNINKELNFKKIKELNLKKEVILEIDTLSGVKYINLKVSNSEITNNKKNKNKAKIDKITVNMGKPDFNVKNIPVIHSKINFLNQEVIIDQENKFKLTCVSIGNPHAVIILNNTKYNLENLNIEKVGSKIENLKIFPEKVNVHFVELINNKEVRMLVWERGSGRTLACGTGACAVVATLVKNKLINKDTEILIHLEGGDLNIIQSSLDDNIYMSGEANIVFEGEYNDEN